MYQIAQRIIFVVSISFLLKYWISPCLGLKTIDNKIKGCCIWIASIYWSWRGSLWLLLVHAVMLLKLIMVPLLSYFLGFLKCQRGHFQFHQIMDKHQKTLNKMVPSLSFIKMKKVDDVLDLLIFRATAFPCPGCEFLVSSARSFLNIFSAASGSFLEVGAFFLTATLVSSSKRLRKWEWFRAASTGLLYSKYFEQILVYLLTWNVLLFLGESTETNVYKLWSGFWNRKYVTESAQLPAMSTKKSTSNLFESCI